MCNGCIRMWNVEIGRGGGGWKVEIRAGKLLKVEIRAKIV